MSRSNNPTKKPRVKKEVLVEAATAAPIPLKDLSTLTLNDKSFLKPRAMPNIHIIGAGGIGGNLVYNLYRDRAALHDMYKNIYLYDGDDVEMKNLMRQNFLNDDIGKNKSTVIAERYKPFLNITAVPSYFNAKFTTDNIRQIDLISSNDIIISCVDNIKTRLDILDEINSIFNELSNNEVPLFIDAGNETFHGSVTFVHNADISKKYFEHLLSRAPTKSDAPYDKSCADYAPQDEGFIQIYTVNMMAAMYASAVLTNYITKSAQFGTTLAENLNNSAHPWTMYRQMATPGVIFSTFNTRVISPNEDFQLYQPEIPNVQVVEAVNEAQ